jgi:hypothetical protein
MAASLVSYTPVPIRKWNWGRIQQLTRTAFRWRRTEIRKENVREYLYTGRFRALVQYWRRLLRRSFGAERIFVRFATVSDWRCFYIDVALYCCDRLTGAPCWVFVEVQTVEAQLSDSDSSTGDKSWQVPITGTEKYSKWSTLKWRLKNATKGRIYFLFYFF